MSYLQSKAYISPKNIYTKYSNYEIWAHLSQNSLNLQCKWYFTDGTIKIFMKTLTLTHNDSSNQDPLQIFKALAENKVISVDYVRGAVMLQIKNNKAMENYFRRDIKLQQNKGLASIDNWMIINILNEKIQSLNNQIEKQQKYIQCNRQNQKQMHDEPIVHENERYCFYAQFDHQLREIKTELVVKLSELDQRIRDKVYKSAIRSVDWDTSEYKQRFKNIQTLFQHLRNANNYEVLAKKGIIKIKNEPDLTLDLTNLTRLKTDRSNKSSKTLSNLKQINSSLRKQTHDQIQYDSIDKNSELTKQLEQISKKIQNKMLTKLKASQKQLISRQRQHQNKNEDRIADIQRELHKYLKTKIKQEMQKIKKQLNSSIIELNKSEFAQRIKNLQKQKDRLKTEQKQEVEEQKILLDKRSTQIQNFNISTNSIIEYKGSWEWTQLFTQISLKNKHRYQIKFKVIKSAYNAIAIGLTANNNFHERSSLTKKYSISYWGDGQIWEGKKIREEGNGFKTGDIILMEVNREQKEICWHVNGKKAAKQASEFLRDKNIYLWAYLQMYDEGDKLQLLTYIQF